jgi:hypothetical protein
VAIGECCEHPDVPASRQAGGIHKVKTAAIAIV